MQKRYILLVIVIILVIFFYTGNRNAEQSISIGDCSARFYNNPITVTSELCSSGKTCVAGAYEQQNNAVVDVLLCACQAAKTGEYADIALTEKIEALVTGFYGYSVTARETCEQQSFLTKRNYG